MEIIFYLFIFTVIVLLVYYSFYYGISPTPTSYKVQKQLLLTIPEEINGKIAELGSAWGTLACALASKLPHCQIQAYEISPLPYLFSKGLAAFYKFPNLEVQRKDFFDISLHQFSLVVCYLYPGAMERLKDKFQNELKPGTYIISHTFAIPGWKEIQRIYVDDLYHTPIYLYQMPKIP
jgi:hypothetical protein